MRSILLGVAAAVTLLVTGSGTSLAQNMTELKLALPTPPSSARNVIADRWAAEVKKASGGKIAIAVFPSGQLYDDTGVAKALASGSLDLAVPNMGHLARVEPNADIFSLPIFAGATADQVFKVVDGPIGKELNALVSKRIRAHVIGGMYTPGAATFFTTKKEIKEIGDFQGLNLRVPGAPTILGVSAALGIKPVGIRTNEMMVAIAQGRVDGLLTTLQGAVSLRVWEAGVKYAWNDNILWSAYVPLASDAVWNKLSADQQNILTAAWAKILPDARTYMLADLDAAQAEMEKAGVVFHGSKSSDVAKVRAQLMKSLPEIVKKAGMDQAFVDKVNAEYEKISGSM